MSVDDVNEIKGVNSVDQLQEACEILKEREA